MKYACEILSTCCGDMVRRRTRQVVRIVPLCSYLSGLAPTEAPAKRRGGRLDGRGKAHRATAPTGVPQHVQAPLCGTETQMLMALADTARMRTSEASPKEGAKRLD